MYILERLKIKEQDNGLLQPQVPPLPRRPYHHQHYLCRRCPLPRLLKREPLPVVSETVREKNADDDEVEREDEDEIEKIVGKRVVGGGMIEYRFTGGTAPSEDEWFAGRPIRRVSNTYKRDEHRARVKGFGSEREVFAQRWQYEKQRQCCNRGVYGAHHRRVEEVMQTKRKLCGLRGWGSVARKA